MSTATKDDQIKLSWWVSGDTNAFFGLGFNTLAAEQLRQMHVQVAVRHDHEHPPVGRSAEPVAQIGTDVDL